MSTKTTNRKHSLFSQNINSSVSSILNHSINLTTKIILIQQQSHHQSMGGMIYRIIFLPLLIITTPLFLECSYRFLCYFCSHFLCCFCYDRYSCDHQPRGHYDELDIFLYCDVLLLVILLFFSFSLYFMMSSYTHLQIQYPFLSSNQSTASVIS